MNSVVVLLFQRVQRYLAKKGCRTNFFIDGARLCAIAPAAATRLATGAWNNPAQPNVWTLLRLVFDTAALRQMGSAMPWNHCKLWTGRKIFVSHPLIKGCHESEKTTDRREGFGANLKLRLREQGREVMRFTGVVINLR